MEPDSVASQSGAEELLARAYCPQCRMPLLMESRCPGYGEAFHRKPRQEVKRPAR